MKNEKGFTLVEIIAAVIILGIISIVAIVTYTGSMKEFRESYYSSLERTMVESGKEFFEDNRSYRPSAIFGAQKVPISLLESRSYIDDVLDYNGKKCDRSSYVIAIKRGKNDYIYHACLVCSEDTFSNIADKYCDSSWEDSSLVRPSLEEMTDAYVYKNTTQEKLREKLRTPVSITKYDREGSVIDSIRGDGIDTVPSILPENIDVVDTARVGTYTVTYRYNNKTVDRKVHVYENSEPEIVLHKTNVYAEKIVENTVTEKTAKTNYASGDWAQELNMEFRAGSTFYTTSGAKVSLYQWNKGGQWNTICTVTSDNGNCSVNYRQEMNEEISFRVIDSEGNISKETSPITIRIDRTPPQCSLKEEGTPGLNDWWNSEITVKFDILRDNISSIASAKSGIKFNQIRREAAEYNSASPGTANLQLVHSDESQYINYYGFVEDKAQNYARCYTKNRKDTVAPTCSITNHATLTCKDDTSKLVKVYFGKTADSASGDALNYLSNYTATGTVDSIGRWYLKATDHSGLTGQTSSMYYLVTYNKNGGDTGPTKTSEIKRETELADLTPTARKAAYKMIGWHTSASSTTALSSHTVTDNVTLYAVYQKCGTGYYTDAVGTGCTQCPAGYRDGEPVGNQADCQKKVPAGHYVKTGNDQNATECATGYYKGEHWVKYGQTSTCTQCPAGYRDGTALANKTAEDKCLRNISAGYYLGTSKGTTNTVCGDGYYKTAHSITYGQTSTCTQCPAGYRNGTTLANKTAENTCLMNVPANNRVASAKAQASACQNCYHSSEHTVTYGNTSSCTANTFTVAFNGNGNTGGATSSKTCTYDQDCTLTANGFTKTAYTFTGWAKTTTGNVEFVNGANAKNVGCSGTTTLYAKWKANCPEGYTEQSDGTCKKTYTATTVYTCNSGDSRNGTTCSHTYNATATATGYSGGCKWVGDSGHYSTKGNCQPRGTISASQLGDCGASNVGETKNAYSCGSGKVAYMCGSVYRCSSYGTSCKADNRNTRASEYKIYTCTCSGSATYSYSCDSGDSRSGTTCTHTYNATVSYTCNGSDTRSGTTCTSIVNPN